MSAISHLIKLVHAARRSVRLVIKAARLVSAFDAIIQANDFPSSVKTASTSLKNAADAFLAEITAYKQDLEG